jgi:transposase
MKWIHGTPRDQLTLFPSSLDGLISQDNEVRLIEAFVNSLPFEEYGFEVKAVEDGRPRYHPSDLLKLFIYGYMNRIRSSRELERASRINIEVLWLLKQLSPDHNTINNFRKDNTKAIKKVFHATVTIAKNFDLIGGKLLAGDSTKFRAQNSKKNNYNKKKVERHQAYIEEKLRQYYEMLEQEEDEAEVARLTQEINKHKERGVKYDKLADHLGKVMGNQISTSDPDARQMIIRNNITEVAYNVQTTVDSSHNLIIDYEVTNTNDSKAMGKMVPRAVEIIGHTDFTMLYDKGYHTGSEFTKAEETEVEVLVAIPAIPSASQAPDPRYNKSEFTYNEKEDTYTCPEGQVLTPAPSTYTHRDSRRPEYEFTFKKYRTDACHECPSRKLCTKSKTNVRHVQRSEHDGAIERNKERMDKKEEIYKQRQAIVEHPFGTMKRQWGFDHVMTKRYKERASADIGLVMCAYNLRRLFNILTFNELHEFFLKMIRIMEKLLSEAGYWFRKYLLKFIINPKGQFKRAPLDKFSCKLEISF